MKAIERVHLSEIKPNECNPRSDFGDIAALADSIRATGGEPVNPIVCVRDGGLLFIVDGERRYRALKEVNGDGDPEITVTVVDGWGEGNEVLAMLATDNKMRLSEAEMGRGYQLAFDLKGADYLNDTQIAMGTGRQTDDVMRARMAWKRIGAGKREDYAQLSLDQLAAAQEFEGRDFDAVLNAKPEAWRAKAQALRAKRVREELDAKVADLCATVGIEWICNAKHEMPPEFEVCREFYTMDAERLGEIEAAIAEKHATALLRRGNNDWRGMYALLRPVSKDSAEAEAARRKADEDRDRAIAYSRELAKNLLLFLAEHPESPNLRELNGRRDYEKRAAADGMARAGVDADTANTLLSEPGSFFEVAKYLTGRMDDRHSSYWATGVLSYARSDGYKPTEQEEWLDDYLSKDGDEG